MTEIISCYVLTGQNSLDQTRPKGAQTAHRERVEMNTLTVKQASELTIGDVIQYSNGVRAEIDYIETANDFGHIRYIIGTVCEGEQFTQDFFPTHLFTVTSR